MPDCVPRSTLDRRLLAIFALITALAAVYLMRSANADLWGHLRYGKLLIVNNGHIPPDPFAYTTAGQRWHNHEYLAQMAFWFTYERLGQVGLVLLKCLLGGGAMLFLLASIRLVSQDARIWAPVLVLTSIMLGRWFAFRPQLFTFFFLAFFVWVLFHHLRTPTERRWTWMLALLPPGILLWVNLHGGFLAGLGVVGLFLGLRGLQSLLANAFRFPVLLRDLVPLGLVLLGCFAASLGNPMGWQLWPYLWTEMSFAPNRQFIDEWQPVRFGTHFWSAVTLVLLVLALVGSTCLASMRRGTRASTLGLPAWIWLLSCLPLMVLAFRSIRHIPVFTIWAAPVLALLAQTAEHAWGSSVSAEPHPEQPLSPPATKPQPRPLPLLCWRFGWVLFAGFSFIPACLAFSLIWNDPSPGINTRGRVLGSRHPHGAVAFLHDHHLKGRVYTPLWWGSYITWKLYPNILVSTDGRNVTLFSGEQVETNLRFYLTEGANLEAPFHPPADYLLMPTDAPALPRVREDERWIEIFADEDAVLLVRKGGPPLDVKHLRSEAASTSPSISREQFP